MKRDINTEKRNVTVKWVSTDWLDNHKDDENLHILDTQPNIHDYITEHIPGAVYFNEHLLRVPFEGKPGIYIPEEVMEKLCRRVGLNIEEPVVVYTGTGDFKKWGDGLEQTMLSYSLARFGHKNVHVLDGGLDKWKQEERTVVKEFPSIQPSTFMVNPQIDFNVNMDEVRTLKESDDTILLDARPEKIYQGQGPWMKPGHIPGAVNLPWKKLMDANNPRLLKSDDELQQIINEIGINQDKLIICSCGTGREATNEFLLFKWYLGYPRVKIYEGSFLEWSAHPENQTVTGSKPFGTQKEIVE